MSFLLFARNLLLVSDAEVREKANELFFRRKGDPGSEKEDWLRAEALCITAKFWKLAGRFTLAVVAGLTVAISWHWINVIKPWRVSLALPYANEYNYRGAKAPADNVRTIIEQVPITVPFSPDPVGFIFAVENGNIRTVKKCSFHLKLPAGVEVTDPGPYVPFLPNQEYFFDLGDVNNGLAKVITDGRTKESKARISFRFNQPGRYRFGYYLAAEDMEGIKKRFIVVVGGG